MKARIVKILFASIFMSGLILSGCLAPKDSQPIATFTYTPAHTNTPFVKYTPQPTRDLPTKTPFSTVDPSTYSRPTSTQAPIMISSAIPSGDEYIYQSTLFGVMNTWNGGEDYFNLDDLTDNSAGAADVLYSFSVGSGGIFADLYAINGATYYFSDFHGMTYQSCMDHYPFTNMDVNYYNFQSISAGGGRDYCVITNEGRLAIFHVAYDSYRACQEWDCNIQFVVTTFKKPIPQAFQPSPTITPGPSPTPGYFDGFNLTDYQQKIIVKAAQEFLDAVKADDREKVSELLEYPFSYDIQMKLYPLEAENKEELFKVYGWVFSPGLRNELATATVENNLEIFYSSIAIVVDDCEIFIRPNGKIYHISRDPDL
ncbi:MAG: hypothetical protein VB013_08595 [Anaerolineaceae bacterium]|nr:hypothetical protein [Anaerolineaceae bacterium]